jgi:hypothetical protein
MPESETSDASRRGIGRASVVIDLRCGCGAGTMSARARPGAPADVARQPDRTEDVAAAQFDAVFYLAGTVRRVSSGRLYRRALVTGECSTDAVGRLSPTNEARSPVEDRPSPDESG